MGITDVLKGQNSDKGRQGSLQAVTKSGKQETSRDEKSGQERDEYNRETANDGETEGPRNGQRFRTVSRFEMCFV